MQNHQSQNNSNVDKLNTSSEETKRLLDAYKEHRQLFLFKLERYQLSLVFRPLTIAEIEAISKISKICTPFGIEDWVIDNCVLYSSINLDNMLAGVTSKTANAILKASSVQDDKAYRDLLNTQRSSAETLDFLVCATINKAYPTLNVYDCNYSQQTKLLALAESMLGTKIMIGEESNKRRRPGPRVPDGYSSISKGDILSPEAADKPDFAKDNAALEGL